MPDSSREKIHRVATYQRAVLISLLANILLTILAFAIMGGAIQLPEMGLVAYRIFSWMAVFFIIGSVIMLAKEFNNTVVAVLCGLLTLVPIVSLVVLVIYSGKATTYLNKHGIKVGFLGVNPNKLPL